MSTSDCMDPIYFVLIFIYKVGSFIWRTLGVLFFAIFTMDLSGCHLYTS